MKTAVMIGRVAAASLSMAGMAQPVYFNDFQSGGAGLEWSNGRVRTTPDGTLRFLGDYSNEEVRLTLGNMQAGKRYRFRSNVCINNTWDGNGFGVGNPGPDIWEMEQLGGAGFFRTTFSRDPLNDTQAFPDPYPGGANPAGLGSSFECECGWRWPTPSCGGDTCPGSTLLFPFKLEFVAFASTQTLAVRAYGLQPIDDESWGLDDVSVECVWADSLSENRSVCVGEPVSFAVRAGGSGPLAYQWRRNGIPLTDTPRRVSGASTAILTLGNVNAVDSGRYECEVKNWCGSALSAAVVLELCAGDFNCDSVIDDTDFGQFAIAYDLLECQAVGMPAGCPQDLNGDGYVDDGDFILFAALYNALMCDPLMKVLG